MVVLGGRVGFGRAGERGCWAGAVTGVEGPLVRLDGLWWTWWGGGEGF